MKQRIPRWLARLLNSAYATVLLAMDVVYNGFMGNYVSACNRWLLSTLASALNHLGGLRLIRAFGDDFRLNICGDSLHFPFVKPAPSRGLQILVYHRINDDGDEIFPGTPSKVFASHMEYLAENYTILALDEAATRAAEGDLPCNAVAITLDDGYRDNYLQGFHILRRLKIPATIFLATDVIGTGRVLWHDRVFSAFRRTRKVYLRAFDSNASSPGFAMRTIGEKLGAQNAVLKVLRAVTESERLTLIDRLVAELEVEDLKTAGDLMLTWDQVREMRASGIDFGSHTATHPILSTLARERIEAEILDSKKIIEDNLGMRINTFAYPNGTRRDFNESTKHILREAGYSCAVTTLSGVNRAGQDKFELLRATPWDQNPNAFALRLGLMKFAS